MVAMVIGFLNSIQLAGAALPLDLDPVFLKEYKDADAQFRMTLYRFEKIIGRCHFESVPGYVLKLNSVGFHSVKYKDITELAREDMLDSLHRYMAPRLMAVAIASMVAGIGFHFRSLGSSFQ